MPAIIDRERTMNRYLGPLRSKSRRSRRPKAGNAVSRHDDAAQAQAGAIANTFAPPSAQGCCSTVSVNACRLPQCRRPARTSIPQRAHRGELGPSSERPPDNHQRQEQGPFKEHGFLAELGPFRDRSRCPCASPQNGAGCKKGQQVTGSRASAYFRTSG